jgi:NAD-dependent deacetylase
MENKVRELKDLMEKARHVVVLTGAGMDTESNIPDFRGKDGLWRNLDPRLLASVDTFEENYPLFREFYATRLKLLETRQPHRGHYILAELEEKGLIQAIATQNVSRLHHLAGSKHVYELHGNIRTFRCHYCNEPAEPEEFFDNRNCSNCAQPGLRPNVTLFGESLPTDAWNNTMTEVLQSDLLIVIGTSLEVSPVNQIPRFAKGKTVYINDEIAAKGYHFDLVIQGKAKKVLEQLEQLI